MGTSGLELSFLEGKRIVLTGGYGFIGSAYLDALLNTGVEEIIVIDVLERGIKQVKQFKNKSDRRIKNYFYDLVDIDSHPQLFQDVDVILHLAAQTSVLESNKDLWKDFSYNVIATIKLLELCRKFDIPFFQFASSGGTVYGESMGKEYEEEDRLRPISMYGASKASVEMYLSAFSSLYDIKTQVLRLGNIYGPGNNKGVMYDFIMKLRKNPSELVILGNGKQKKSYLYISDTIHGFLIALAYLHRERKGFDAFNLGGPAYTVDEIAKIIIQELGLDLDKVKFKYTGGARGWEGDVALSLMATEKIQGIGWSLKTPIHEGIKKLIESLSPQQ